ncbi:uncharacterized protein LOC128988558 [Macrosteles quadrilineatus]|uniref:uncharacterized protein LOC128988558 n=1 Tax=Macrosteles quadrilineatus TaxID=74068 RepID=UPI0023E2EF34|nr:uncharacterized protein LOC128988558 [Macrosteles quadrilineatus]
MDRQKQQLLSELSDALLFIICYQVSKWAHVDKLLAETILAGEYLALFEAVKLRVQNVLQQSNDVVSAHSGSCCNNASKKKFKLPKIEIKKFDGELINWLPFWSQFSKIHSDSDIDSEDKFQYLLQSIVTGSRAFDVVQSFPPTGANYPKAIECLKARFGKDDLLVEVYVRELLKIVLQNALGGKNTMNLQSLYDKLESHMRALDTLGVTTDKCSSMLYPLVESCMPEDLLRAWQRSPLKVGTDPQERLNNLMKFMLSEVEGEQRIGLAMAGFGISSSGKEKSFKRSPQTQPGKIDIPTASCLMSSGKTQNSYTKCVFCDKNHKSSNCFAAQKLPLSHKVSTLKEKRCCFLCLQPGHRIKNCRAHLSCSNCKRKHYPIMCPSIHSKEVVNECVSKCVDEVSKEITVVEDTALANKSSSRVKVFLQTVRARLRTPGSNQFETVRILFDSGSQRSYILKDLAEKMNYESLGEETIIHSLFGNVKSGEVIHNRHRVFLTSQDYSYNCNFEVLSQTTICGEIPPVTEGPWIQELLEKNVSLTDIHETELPIGILIGADIVGKLFTRNMIQLKSGLVAMEILGWTLMGKAISSGSTGSTTLSTVVTSMFINDADISELWRLDTIGITDTSESVSKEQKALAVKKHFIKTTTINEEGRYEVSLPWVDCHPPLPSNRELAEKRLSTVVKKLDGNNLTEDYDSVFKQWLSDGIIEAVPSDDLNNNFHYLPHRPVVKESSITTRIRPVFDASAKTKFSPSLNDCIENGPNLIELIPSVMMRFREGKFGVIADIAKAFLQISLNVQDRDFLRFLWFDINERSRSIVYRHKRVVFGVKCSPFLLGAVIDLHLQKSMTSQEFDDNVVKKLSKSFYVDNVSTSVDTYEELKHFVEESKQVMAAAKFDLRGWHATSVIEEGDNKFVTNVLGVQWNYIEDVLFFNLTNCIKDLDVSRITKRDILSISHKIFDPIGILCPVTLFPKLLLQSMWDLKIDWDTEAAKLREEVDEA